MLMLIITRSTDGEDVYVNEDFRVWANDGADVTWGGRSFHVLAPETGKARLPTVERWIDSTANARRWEAEDATVV